MQVWTDSMARLVRVAVAAAVWTLLPSVVHAQQFPFERSYAVEGSSTLDVSTIRGKIDIVAGDPDRIIVSGTVTVRFGLDVPANAESLARQVADSPPIERTASTVRLRPPSDAAARRAVTVSYAIQVPPNTEVHSLSDSGATTVRGLAAPVTVRTQSGAIEASSLSGTVAITSGSGAVKVDSIAGPLAVRTGSSAFSGRALGSSLHIRTSSGDVDGVLTGTGDVDVETGSSTIRLEGLQGGLTARTQSGRISIQGVPRRPWTATTGSSGVGLTIGSDAAFSIDAASRSGSVTVEGAEVDGSVTKRRITGSIGGGGPLVRVESGSGAITVRVAAR